MTIKKILVNANEEKTDTILRAVMERHGYRVCPKMRVADVIEVSRNKLGNKFNYATGAHFDFTVADNENNPKFSVEFDGESHRDEYASRKDQFKNEICMENDYPLIRINSAFFNEVGKFNVLSWLLEVWCLAQAFYQEQEKGNILEDEDFDYWCVSELTEDLKIRFPYNPFLQYVNFFRKLYIEKKIVSGPHGIIYSTEDGFTYCKTIIVLNSSEALKQHCGVQSYAFFPVPDFELCENLNLLFIHNQYLQYAKTSKGAINTEKAFKEFNALSKKYDCSWFGLNLPASPIISKEGFTEKT